MVKQATKQNNAGSTGSPLIVGVGASAGGLEAFEQLLAELDDYSAFAVVFVQHRDPNTSELLIDSLKKSTANEVVEITRRVSLQAGTAYVAPATGVLEIHDSVITPVAAEDDRFSSSAIDHFLHSLAEDQSDRAIGVILSGAGSDGTLGLKAISDAGGLTFAQAAESAKFDSMPRNAAITGVADHVLAPADIAKELISYARHIAGLAEPKRQDVFHDRLEQSIPAIAERLLEETGHNFQHYKLSTLGRRIQRRMQVLKLSDVDHYVTLLKAGPEEPHALFRELLIGVTAFFRDPESFAELARQVIPELFTNRQPDEPVRIWVPGCATGEEAYSLAILCREYIDSAQPDRSEQPDPAEPARGATQPEVQIFATDIDERALQVARTGSYPVGIQEQLSSERLERYFSKRGKRYHVTKEIRELVLFSPHNLICDPPFSRQDLISCRNLLIYLGPHLQKKLVPVFHYALRPAGYLFLGPSETLTPHADLFQPVSTRHRISQRKGTAVGTTRPVSSRAIGSAPPTGDRETSQEEVAEDVTAVMQRVVLDEFAPKSVVVNDSGQILTASANMQKYLTVDGGPFQNNIIKLARRGLRIGLRSALTEAKDTRRRVTYEDLSVHVSEGRQRIMLTVQPMPEMGADEGLFLVMFHDVGTPIDPGETADTDPSQKVHDNEAEVMVAHIERELANTRDSLEKTMQDMEAANEELKSSNEELRSMNEELATSKEEIQAGSDALAAAHSDLENLLRSTQIATIFLDRDLNIRSFTPAATEIYGMISTDVGRPLTQLMPLADDMPPLPDPNIVTAEEPVEDTAQTRNGKWFIRRVLPYQGHEGRTEGIVVTFVDITERKLHDIQLTEALAKLDLSMQVSEVATWTWNMKNNDVNADENLKRLFGFQPEEEVRVDNFLQRIHEGDRRRVTEAIEQTVRNAEPYQQEYRINLPSRETRWLRARGQAQQGPDGSVQDFFGVVFDITHRKLQELEVADREAHLRRVIDNMLGLVGVLDTNGILLEANATAIAAGGVSRDDVIGKPFWECYWWNHDQAIADQLREAFSRAVTGEIVRYDVKVRMAEDTRMTIDFMLAPVSDADGNVTHVIPSGLDITGRVNAEVDARDTAVRLEAIFNTAVDGIISIDRVGTINSVNNAAMGVFGYTAEELLGRNVKMLMPEPWHSEHDSYLAAFASTHEPKIIGMKREVRGLRKNGSTFPLELAVSETTLSGDHCYVGIVRDITVRRGFEQTIRENEGRLAMALKAGGMAAWEWTPERSFWTDELYDLIGIPKDREAAPETFFDYVHPEDVHMLQEAWLRATSGEVQYDQEFRIIRPDGKHRWICGVGQVARDANGNVTRVFGLNWDNTRDHIAAERLRESERRAQAASASKSEFVANMSHEIRTPMTAVLGYTDLLLRTEDHPQKIDYLQTIKRNGNFLLEIINDILDLSKIEAGRMEITPQRFAPHKLVGDVQSLMEVRAGEKNLTFLVNYDGPIPAEIESDPKRLKQILVNLLGNAIKFTNSGRVELTVWFTEVDEPQLQFDVSDTGIGITEEQQTRLFKPFSQGDASVNRSFGGTGLGLAISRRLATMLGGDISVQSRFGGGSTFSCTIAVGKVDTNNLVQPKTDSLAAADLPAESKPGDLPPSAGPNPATGDSDRVICRILLVDDRRDVRHLAKHFLTNAGAEVEVARDGLEAVEFMERVLAGDIRDIDLVLLDMQMPRLDGYETATRLRKMGFDKPIIALTADAMHGDMNKCLESGCNAYLSKPIDAAALLEIVAAYAG